MPPLSVPCSACLFDKWFVQYVTAPVLYFNINEYSPTQFTHLIPYPSLPLIALHFRKRTHMCFHPFIYFLFVFLLFRVYSILPNHSSVSLLSLLAFSLISSISFSSTNKRCRVFLA